MLPKPLRWASSTPSYRLRQLEEETVQWCREILANSPLAIRCLKSALNADCDGQAGLQELAGNATMLYYMSEEGQEGRNAFVEKRKPDFSKFPKTTLNASHIVLYRYAIPFTEPITVKGQRLLQREGIIIALKSPEERHDCLW